MVGCEIRKQEGVVCYEQRRVGVDEGRALGRF